MVCFVRPAEGASGAVGSAREWHSRGRRFDPGLVHQQLNSYKQTTSKACRRICTIAVTRRGCFDADDVEMPGGLEHVAIVGVHLLKAMRRGTGEMKGVD
jgi:hypothetical protein